MTENNLPKNLGRFKPTFTDGQLQNLKKYVEKLDKRAFGLTKEAFGRIVFEYAEENQIEHPFNREKREAGRDFVEFCMKKFNFSLRKPEPTSLARLSAFNKVNIDKFFTECVELRSAKNFDAFQIYNMDETGWLTVPTKTPLVISPKGARRVIKVTSAERGTNVSVACCASATGHFIPPFFIYPGTKMQSAWLHNKPAGSDGIVTKSGWMTSDAFLRWLQHFKSHASPSEEKPILILLDNHSSHVTLAAVNFKLFLKFNFLFTLLNFTLIFLCLTYCFPTFTCCKFISVFI